MCRSGAQGGNLKPSQLADSTKPRFLDFDTDGSDTKSFQRLQIVWSGSPADRCRLLATLSWAAATCKRRPLTWIPRSTDDVVCETQAFFGGINSPEGFVENIKQFQDLYKDNSTANEQHEVCIRTQARWLYAESTKAENEQQRRNTRKHA